MNNRGTLLSATIVVGLSLILLFGFFYFVYKVKLGALNKARESSIESSVLGYVDAVEKQIMINEMDASLPKIIDDTYTISKDGIIGTKNGNQDKIAVEVKGAVPSGTIIIKNHKVTSSSIFTLNGYNVSYDASAKKTYIIKKGESNTENSLNDESSSNTGSGSNNKESGSNKKNVPTIDTCPGCKFIYTTNNLYIFSNMPKEATDDYTTLTGKEGHSYFLGILESTTTPGKIGRAFVCGIENGTPFCLEGYDKTKYNDSNISILNKIYPSCNGESYCKGNSVDSSADTTGKVGITGSDGFCSVSFTGSFYCDNFDFEH